MTTKEVIKIITLKPSEHAKAVEAKSFAQVIALDNKIKTNKEAEARLLEISRYLSLEDTTLTSLGPTGSERAHDCLEIERLYLEGRTGTLPMVAMSAQVQQKLQDLEYNSPRIFEWMESEGVKDRIRMKVMETVESAAQPSSVANCTVPHSVAS